MHYIVYKTTNLINKKIYIGAHKTKNIEDGYLGSGKILLKAIEKYGSDSFKREILFELNDTTEMYKIEAQIVNKKFVSSKNTYNIKCGGCGGFDYINSQGLGSKKGISPSPETRSRISKSRMGQKPGEATREKQRRNSWARKDPEAQRNHIRKIGSRPKSEEHKRKLSKSLMGKRKGEKQPRIQCPHCKFIGGASGVKRWHMDNCKLRA